MMVLNEEDIRKYYRFLGHKGITELRPILPRWDSRAELIEFKPKSYFITGEDELINNIRKVNGEYNIYVGLNERATKGKGDEDVKWITNVGHDIDAHQTGDNGIVTAGQIALEIVQDSVKQGYEEPLILNSGRGYWVIHHIEPIENTEQNVKKIKEFGKRIAEKYGKDIIDFDSSVYNPSRIARVAGTLNVSTKDFPVMSGILNNPTGIADGKLTKDILNIEIKEYVKTTTLQQTPEMGISSFMDYCLTHELPKGERHKVISRNMALYISDKPDRQILKEQYIKIQKATPTELDQWLANIDKNGKDKYPFSIGELYNFTKKYKIPFDWTITPEYKQWMKEKKAQKLLDNEIAKEKRAEEMNKTITFFMNKKHLAQQFLAIHPVYYDEAKLWWVWNEEQKFWELTDEVDIMNYISGCSEADTISSKERNEIIEALKQESRKIKPKDMKNTWIQFKNIIYDLDNEETINATPEYFITNPIPWELSESEETPVMDRIFTEWVGEDNKKTLYQILAYCMINDYPIHRIFCFIGAGLNGKSKYLDLLRTFIGENNCCSTELDTLIASRFEVTRLHKKLVCQMGETNFGELSKTSLLKKLSGGDLIGFEYKNKNPFEDKNTAKIIISTNNLPTTTDKTVGFYRRWMIIDFPNRFSEKKDILKDIPEEEYSNLTRKCLNILKVLLSERQFHNEGTIEERMEKYESKSNFIERFLKEFTTEDFGTYITKSDFYKKFCAWSHDNRHREMSEMAVSMALKKMGVLEDKKYFDWLYDGKGGQARVWLGIKWK